MSNRNLLNSEGLPKSRRTYLCLPKVEEMAEFLSAVKEFNLPLRKSFTYRSTDLNVNLHIFEENDPEVELNLLFRDYLRENVQARDQYAALKYKLLEDDASHKKDGAIYRGYTLGKHDLIQDILNKSGFKRLRFVICTHRNVLPGFRNKGIDSALIETCEKYAAKKLNIVGIGVGLYPDYGSAGRLYVKHGYIPDGHGATYNYKYVTPGKEYPLDDDLVLWFTKKLNNIPRLKKSNESIIFQTRNWIVSHRKDSRYLGYLIISSVSSSDELHKLSSRALQEVGIVIANTEKLLKLAYAPYKIIFSKLGFSAGYNCHFHVIPVFDHILHEIIGHSNYTSEPPDGKDVMLFISREYCEKPLSEQGKSNIKLTEKKLKNLFDTNFNTNGEFQ